MPITDIPVKREKSKQSVALAAFFNIAEKWNLTVADQMNLLGVDVLETYCNAKNNPSKPQIDEEVLQRLSYVLGIFTDLQVLFPDADVSDDLFEACRN